MSKVLVAQYERNLYEDSDGIAVVYDRNTKSFENIITWTTRGGCPSDQLANIDRTLTPADQFGIRRAFVKHAHTVGHIHEGDTVVITKGRKYPHGIKFKVSHFDYFIDMYGEVRTSYLVGTDTQGNHIKTNITNCILVKPTRFNRSLFLYNPRMV